MVLVMEEEEDIRDHTARRDRVPSPVVIRTVATVWMTWKQSCWLTWKNYNASSRTKKNRPKMAKTANREVWIARVMEDDIPDLAAKQDGGGPTKKPQMWMMTTCLWIWRSCNASSRKKPRIKSTKCYRRKNKQNQPDGNPSVGKGVTDFDKVQRSGQPKPLVATLTVNNLRVNNLQGDRAGGIRSRQLKRQQRRTRSWRQTQLEQNSANLRQISMTTQAQMGGESKEIMTLPRVLGPILQISSK
mmetsp:Transcript_16791/g.36642  ORF Transcript_16791/g.36642 Transcript_16791/m.36642 type:complete len:244 (+) Transcript_16791:393-1124(+)